MIEPEFALVSFLVFFAAMAGIVLAFGFLVVMTWPAQSASQSNPEGSSEPETEECPYCHSEDCRCW